MIPKLRIIINFHTEYVSRSTNFEKPHAALSSRGTLRQFQNNHNETMINSTSQPRPDFGINHVSDLKFVYIHISQGKIKARNVKYLFSCFHSGFVSFSKAFPEAAPLFCRFLTSSRNAFLPETEDIVWENAFSNQSRFAGKQQCFFFLSPFFLIFSKRQLLSDLRKFPV